MARPFKVRELKRRKNKNVSNKKVIKVLACPRNLIFLTAINKLKTFTNLKIVKCLQSTSSNSLYIKKENIKIY